MTSVVLKLGVTMPTCIFSVFRKHAGRGVCVDVHMEPRDKLLPVSLCCRKNTPAGDNAHTHPGNVLIRLVPTSIETHFKKFN